MVVIIVAQHWGPLLAHIVIIVNQPRCVFCSLRCQLSPSRVVIILSYIGHLIVEIKWSLIVVIHGVAYSLGRCRHTFMVGCSLVAISWPKSQN